MRQFREDKDFELIFWNADFAGLLDLDDGIYYDKDGNEVECDIKRKIRELMLTDGNHFFKVKNVDDDFITDRVPEAVQKLIAL